MEGQRGHLDIGNQIYWLKSLSYYTKAIDSHILPGVNTTTITHNKHTADTISDTNIPMDYASIYSNDIVCYHANNMYLYIGSNATYIVLPNTKNRGTELFYFSNTLPYTSTILSPNSNDATLTKYFTIKNTPSSAA